MQALTVTEAAGDVCAARAREGDGLCERGARTADGVDAQKERAREEARTRVRGGVLCCEAGGDRGARGHEHGQMRCWAGRDTDGERNWGAAARGSL